MMICNDLENCQKFALEIDVNQIVERDRVLFLCKIHFVTQCWLIPTTQIFLTVRLFNRESAIVQEAL